MFLFFHLGVIYIVEFMAISDRYWPEQLKEINYLIH